MGAILYLYTNDVYALWLEFPVVNSSPCLAHLPPTKTVCPRTVEMIDGLSASLSWPETDAGNFSAIQCPCRAAPELTDSLFAIRACGAEGSWLPSDYSVCVSDTSMALCEVRTYVYE